MMNYIIEMAVEVKYVTIYKNVLITYNNYNYILIIIGFKYFSKFN